MSAAAPELVFNFADGQNQFFVELAEALVFELAQQGVPARIAFGEYPEPRAGRVFVLVPPHEYVTLTGFRPPPELLQRCIGISAEQPTSGFFASNVELARDFGAVFDINVRAVRAYRWAGVEARQFELGYCQLWDRFDDPADRDVDILFMGRATLRREQALASYAEAFERFRCHIQLSDGARPSLEGAPDFLAGDSKRDLLARTKVLLTVHGENEPYFEWLRVVEAICAGCLVVSEHSSDTTPLRSGEHIITGGIDRLGALCVWAASDAPGRERIRRAAYDLLVRERPLAAAAAELARAAQRVDDVPVPTTGLIQARIDFLRASRHGGLRFELQPPESPHSPAASRVLRALKSQTLATSNLHRRVELLGQRINGDSDPGDLITVRYETPGWTTAPEREITVVIPLYNHGDVVANALDSIEQSHAGNWEIVVVNDGSTDDGAEVVEAWMRARESAPCRLVSHTVNRGLAHARNTGIEHATTELLLMLDADNALLSIATTRLLEALRHDPDASFAYGIVAQFSADGPVGLLSEFAWDPERLRVGNYIDALALIRREALTELGGYSYDQRLLGWEDYDLWARMAESGRHGAFAPQVVARYHVGHSSMVSVTNISVTDALAAIADHAPRLMQSLRIPD